jgi:hypothetical protein
MRRWEQPSFALSYSATFDRHVARGRPALLYHYTSSAGLLGILSSMRVWATSVEHLNDWKEIDFAVDLAKQLLLNRFSDAARTQEDRDLVQAMFNTVGTAAKRHYVFSLSEVGDLLSQWRAYCSVGGYSIGIPSVQLARMAAAQQFVLWPCVYGAPAMLMVQEMITAHIARYSALRQSGIAVDPATQTISWALAQHITLFGTAMKHDSFAEEREWRLVGTVDERHPQINFRPGRFGLVPHYEFQLVSEAHPSLINVDGASLLVISGPGVNQGALQYYLSKAVPGAHRGASAAPYRG